MSLIRYLAVILQGKVESETDNSLSLGASRDLQALNDTGVALVFETRVLTLSVLTNDSKVDVAMTGRESREGLAKDDGGINI